MTRDYSVIVPLMIAYLVSLFIASRLQKQPIYEALAMQRWHTFAFGRITATAFPATDHPDRAPGDRVYASGHHGSGSIGTSPPQ